MRLSGMDQMPTMPPKLDNGSETRMALFARLRAARAFERRHLGHLRTMEDVDLVREIGYHQEQGRPLTMKQLYLLDLASVATVQRRLRHLRQAGVIVPRKSERDGRTVELTISPKLQKAYARYLELLCANVDPAANGAS